MRKQFCARLRYQRSLKAGSHGACLLLGDNIDNVGMYVGSITGRLAVVCSLAFYPIVFLVKSIFRYKIIKSAYLIESE